MSRRRGALVALAALLLAGCAGAAGSSSAQYEAPRARCLGQSGREASSDSARPLFFFFCVESP